MLCINATMANMDLSNHNRYVLASNNPAKLNEIMPMFCEAGLVLSSPADWGVALAPVESGSTYIENSRIKAMETYKALKDAGCCFRAVFADDSGLEVDALGGLPGVHSASFLGEDASYETRNMRIMKEVENKSRAAVFVAVITCVFECGTTEVFRGQVAGQVAESLSGTGGFGYDPIFYLPELGKTMAELTLTEKNQISHRGLATRQLIRRLYENSFGERHPR